MSLTSRAFLVLAVPLGLLLAPAAALAQSGSAADEEAKYGEIPPDSAPPPSAPPPAEKPPAPKPPTPKPPTSTPPPADKPPADKPPSDKPPADRPPSTPKPPTATPGGGGGGGGGMPGGGGEPKPGTGTEPGKKPGTEPEPKPGTGTEPEKKGSGAEPEKKGSGAEPEKKGSGAEPDKKKGSGAEPDKKKGSGAEPDKKKGSGAEPDKQKPGTGVADPRMDAPRDGTGTSGEPGLGGGSESWVDLDLPVGAPMDVQAALQRSSAPRPPAEDPRDAIPPPTFFGEEIVSENSTLVYVIDCSGSMRLDPQPFVGDDGQVLSGTRMDRARAELGRSILGLAPNFRFNVVAYSCTTRQWSAGLMEATVANKRAAVDWIRSQAAEGATGTGPATALALANQDNMAVVLLTDGQPNCGADGLPGHRRMIRARNLQGAQINVFGIAATGEYRGFCQDVAKDSGGQFVDVP